MSPTPLISDEYRRMQEELHRNPQYGVASLEYAPLVAEVVNGNRLSEVLDYGAGKGRLAEALKKLVSWPVTVHHYDPAMPQWSRPPAPCVCVACIDVLEHIEPELLPNVLDDLKRVVAGVGVFTIATGPAAKILSDGRNAHLIQQKASWWLPQLLSRFELMGFGRMPGGFWVVVEKLQPDVQARA